MAFDEVVALVGGWILDAVDEAGNAGGAHFLKGGADGSETRHARGRFDAVEAGD